MSAWRALHERSGCASANGLGMLAHQAALQLQWWWDVPIDRRATVEGHFMTDTLSSMSSRIRSKTDLDLRLACGLIALGVTGVVMIYSATRQGTHQRRPTTRTTTLERQGFFVGIGIIVMYRGLVDRLSTAGDLDDAVLRVLPAGLAVLIRRQRPSGHSAGTASHIAGTTERVHRADTHSRGATFCQRDRRAHMYDVVRYW